MISSTHMQGVCMHVFVYVKVDFQRFDMHSLANINSLSLRTQVETL